MRLASKIIWITTICISFFYGHAQNLYVNTVAGNGIYGYSGDGGPAINAMINAPSDIAFDSKGNLYICDYSNERIRRIDTGGIIITVAGNGIAGYSGDGGLAINAQLDGPGRIAIDNSDNIYIVQNKRIRKINSSGIITTIAGNGNSNFTGDGGLALSSGLGNIFGIASDTSGCLYLTCIDDRIRKIDKSGIITVVSGNGTPGYSGDGGMALLAKVNTPMAITCDKAGNVYFSDEQNYRIRKINSSGIINTLYGNGGFGYTGDGGQASLCQLGSIRGITFDLFGNLYLTDAYHNVIRRIDMSGIISTIGGNNVIGSGFGGDGGPALSAKFYGPNTITCNKKSIFFCDLGNNRIREVHCNKNDTTCDAFTIDLQEIDNLENKFIFYPNPSTGILFIKGFSKKVEISISNVNNELLYVANYFLMEDKEIKIDEFENGIYFLKVTSESETILRKIVVLKN